MNKIIRLLKTLRYFSASQLAHQVCASIRAKLECPARFAVKDIGLFPGCRWKPRDAFLSPGIQQNDSVSMGRGEFTFLNVARQVGWPPRWDCEGVARHWNLNLHYFDFIWALDVQSARFLVDNWIAEYPLARGREGWDSYAISLRLVNWSTFFFGVHLEATRADDAFAQRLWQSICRQTEWLRQHLELNVGGNHLIENIAALAVVGSCFAGDRAALWYRDSLRLLGREIPQQVLEDGAHFARAPMYQCRMIFVLGTLLNTDDPGLASCVQQPLLRMLRELEDVCHPDGDIALFNDSASAVYNRPAQLMAYVQKLMGSSICGSNEQSRLICLPSAGFYGASVNGGSYVLVDGGPNSGRYIPGHGHGGMLGFELSWQGRRCIVDGGLFEYVAGDMRDYCRSTRAHNTVEINGQDQNEYWDVFRVATLGRVRDGRFEATRTGFRFSGWHDGYERLAGQPRHARQATWYHHGLLMVKDYVRSRKAVTSVSRLHFHPDWQVRLMGDCRAVVEGGGSTLVVQFVGSGCLQVEPSLYCPEFGKQLAGQGLAFSSKGTNVYTGFCISFLPGDLVFDLKTGATISDTQYMW